mmetsp:Transcript_16790/g.36640  ORF Transcript_16790/g.36640 Transcript_16790/m.36640 type:complete len:245 (+) Transcript_16790:74-808(+)|eukprot:CAMPEP_0168185468 /NCGR_PEP_ID=MMETSP0139_2-20121125/13862_1 /TAXON_ID=44445 /ORGANISM="Pseudo-nitzschia australis, Strain 10249 10 AB" /LENGTH=244 /DNA_ID=CAMNT_0008107305 /DNA_START=84 /DNA_END=818 /DNA_ORIENTATION=+
MVLSNKGGKALLAILVLAIASRPSCIIAFLPHSTPIGHCSSSSTLPRYNANHGQQSEHAQKRHHNAMATTQTTTTTLHMSPEVLAGAASLVAGFAGWLYIDGAGDRDRRAIREEEEARIQAIQDERAKRAYIEPKDFWTEAELAPYDGSHDEDGPILFAADGLVFNVYKGRNFYLPGCEYHIFAGRDATRLLARNKLEEETEEEAKKPLNMAERAFLATWMYTFKGKYDIVGKLEEFNPQSTAM